MPAAKPPHLSHQGISEEHLLTLAQERSAMWDMRISGYRAVEIAAAFGVEASTVRRELRIAVQQIDATKWLEVETQTDLDRLERLFRAYWPYALGDKGQDRDPDAAHLVLKILDQKAKLLGLNAPKRVDISLLIAQWAEEKGLDARDVIDVTDTLFPRPIAER